jgi:hypothetical protein
MALSPKPINLGGFGGMTVNERLFTAGTIEQFYSAAGRGDRAAMIGLLKDVKIGDDLAEKIADTVLANPEKFGIRTIGNSD